MDMKVRSGVTFYTDEGEKFFGEGPYRLMCGIRRLGSLRAAAQELNMAYTKAFHVMKNMEKHCGFPLVERKIGGRGGGGSTLTPQAEELLLRYEWFKLACGRMTQQMYRDYFSDIWPEDCGKREEA